MPEYQVKFVKDQKENKRALLNLELGEQIQLEKVHNLIYHLFFEKCEIVDSLTNTAITTDQELHNVIQYVQKNNLRELKFKLTGTAEKKGNGTNINFSHSLSRPDLQKFQASSFAYFTKIISWKGSRVVIILQNESGPCPFIAIVNILSLRGDISLPINVPSFSFENLSTHLFEYLLANHCTETQIGEVLQVLPTLQRGLDVNIQFHDIDKYEESIETNIFKVFHCQLVHGWVFDREDKNENRLIGEYSFNDLQNQLAYAEQLEQKGTFSEDYMEMISDLEKEKVRNEANFVINFLERTSSQFTPVGLHLLTQNLHEKEFYVLFRNNHYSVIYKYQGQLYTLVTDTGLAQEDGLIWELVDSVNGVGTFYNAYFESFKSSSCCVQ